MYIEIHICMLIYIHIYIYKDIHVGGLLGPKRPQSAPNLPKSDANRSRSGPKKLHNCLQEGPARPPRRRQKAAKRPRTHSPGTKVGWAEGHYVRRPVWSCHKGRAELLNVVFFQFPVGSRPIAPATREDLPIQRRRRIFPERPPGTSATGWKAAASLQAPCQGKNEHFSNE